VLDWLRLFRVARSLIRQVNSDQPIIDHWTFGGGTAMMIQIDHRESHDVDFFRADPQLLPFLDPQKHDFQFEIQPDGYAGDGARSLKIAFTGIGIQALTTIEKLNPDFVDAAIGELAIKDRYKEIAKKAIEKSKNILRAV
jgi:hypothetical protein